MPKTDFNKHSARKDGLHNHCRVCVAKAREAYRIKNPDWRERKREYDKTWYPANFEKISAKGKENYAKDREAKKAKVIQWARENREKRRIISRNYQHRRRAKQAEGISTKELREWYEHQERICYWCGTTETEIWSIDHVVPLSKGGAHQCDNLVLACMPCNSLKGSKDPEDFALEIKQKINRPKDADQ